VRRVHQGVDAVGVFSTAPAKIFSGHGKLSAMLEVRTAATEVLDEADLAGIRALMDASFGDRFDDHDWDHTLGGRHVLGFLDGALIAHASVIGRTLWCGDRAMRTGYVEAVAVHPDHQREGHGATVRSAAAELIENEYEIGALCAGEIAQLLYRKLGWVVWQGPSAVAAPSGRMATPEEDGFILVLPQPDLDITAPITCDWRSGDVW